MISLPNLFFRFKTLFRKPVCTNDPVKDFVAFQTKLHQQHVEQNNMMRSLMESKIYSQEAIAQKQYEDLIRVTASVDKKLST